MVIFIIVALFVLIFLYLFYLYWVRQLFWLIKFAIDWKVLRIMTYIVWAVAAVIIPHLLFLGLLIIIL